jgi:hypothetical protein
LSVLIQQTWLQFNDETDNLKQTYERFEDTKALSEVINRRRAANKMAKIKRTKGHMMRNSREN